MALYSLIDGAARQGQPVQRRDFGLERRYGLTDLPKLDLAGFSARAEDLRGLFNLSAQSLIAFIP